jgi:hypothetical protein
MSYRKPMPDSKSAREVVDHYFARSREQSDINDGEPWSDRDIADLRNHVAHGASLGETATFLCRAGTADEVALTATQLGLKWKKGARKRRPRNAGETQSPGG